MSWLIFENFNLNFCVLAGNRAQNMFTLTSLFKLGTCLLFSLYSMWNFLFFKSVKYQPNKIKLPHSDSESFQLFIESVMLFTQNLMFSRFLKPICGACLVLSHAQLLEQSLNYEQNCLSRFQVLNTPVVPLFTDTLLSRSSKLSNAFILTLLTLF